MTRKDKIQHLLITHLLETGSIKLVLPDEMVIELGIIKEDKYGNLKKLDNYCWAIASQKEREVSIDSYNLGLRYNETGGKMLIEDNRETDEGGNVRCFNVI